MIRIAQWIAPASALLALSACDNPFAPKQQVSGTNTPGTNMQEAPQPASSPAAPTATLPPPAAPVGPLRPNGTTLDAPDAQNVALLYYSFAPPTPLQDWIDADVRGSGANEFERTPQRQKLEAQLARVSAEAARVGRVVLHVNAELSEYDPQAGMYYIDLFGSGSTMSWNYRGKSYGIDFINREDAQGWSLAPDTAAKVLERNRGSRDVVITVTLDIIGHHARSDGGVIEGRVLSYVIDGRWTDTRLGSVTVPGQGK